jgi:glutaredoxin-related protein
VVNVLDEVHNPGLRETIKTFSQWPTIPQVGINATVCPCAPRPDPLPVHMQLRSARQGSHGLHADAQHLTARSLTVLCCCLQLYVDGELVGGADIVTEMAEKGELQPLLRGQ